MATSFTAEQLLAFTTTLVEKALPLPTLADGDTNQKVISLTTAGGPAGMLVNMQTDAGLLKVYLNPVIAVQLLLGIFQTNADIGLCDQQMNLIPKPD